VSARRVFVVAVADDSAEEDLKRWFRAVNIAAQEAATVPGISEVEIVLGLPSGRAIGFPSGDSPSGSAIRVAELGAAESVPAALNLIVLGLSRAAAQDVIVLLDPRCLPSRDTLRRLVTDVVDEEVGLVQARQIPFEGYQGFDPDTREMSWAVSSAAATRLEVFAAVNGFDTEHFSTRVSDVDLSWRIVAEGWRIRYCPDAVVFTDGTFADRSLSWRAKPGDGDRTLDHLNLLRRFGSSRILNEALAWVDESGDAAQVAAAEVFRASERNNGSIEPSSGAEDSASFGDDFYGADRFAD